MPLFSPDDPFTPVTVEPATQARDQAAFGIFPGSGRRPASANRPGPGASVLDRPRPANQGAPSNPFTSRAPVRPEVRQQIERAWDAATQDQRSILEGDLGWKGQIARDRAEMFRQADAAREGLAPSSRATTDGADPRAEFRAQRLRIQGEDPRFADTAGRAGAAAGAPPGREIQALGGTAQPSKFDFDTSTLFDPERGAAPLNNPVVRGLTKGGAGLGKFYSGLFEFQADAMGLDQASRSARQFGERMRGVEEAVGERGDFLTRNFEGAISSVAQQLPLLIAGVATASQAIPLAGMAVQAFGQEYSDGKARGQHPVQATYRASLMAALEVVGEKFGLGSQMDALRAAARGAPTGEIGKLLFDALQKQVPGELLTTTGQFAVDKFAGGGVGLTPQATFDDYLKQVADTVAQTLMQSGVMAGGTTGVSAGVQFLRDRGVGAGVAEADAERAKQQALAKWQALMGGVPPANGSGPAAPGRGPTAPVGAPVGTTLALPPAERRDPEFGPEPPPGQAGGSDGPPLFPEQSLADPAPSAPSGDGQALLSRLAELQVLAQTRPLTQPEQDESARILMFLDEDAQALAAPTAPVGPAGGLPPPPNPTPALVGPAAGVLPPASFPGSILPTTPVPPAATTPADAAPIDPALQDMQNRDRRRAASVAQMQAIANNPDYLRAGPSRTPDSGAPMVWAPGDQPPVLPGAFGREDIAVMADGQRVPFRYAVVDASVLQPSNWADGSTNPVFAQRAPGTLIALNNGRTAGLVEAYSRGTAERYKAELVADAQTHGVDPAAVAQLERPVLVRVYSERDNTANMAAKSQGQGMGMSATEQALNDARLVDGPLLALYQGGDVDAINNLDFVRGFVGKLRSTGADVAAMMTGAGTVSQEGMRRMQAAMMATAYGRPDLVQGLYESPDTDIAAIGGALRQMAGRWAQMRDMAASGAIEPGFDITTDLLQAVDMVQTARRQRKGLLDLASQVDLETGRPADELTVEALRVLYGGQNLTRARGREKVASILGGYVDAALAAGAGGGLFGDAPTPLQTLRSLNDAAEGAANAARAQPDDLPRQGVGGNAPAAAPPAAPQGPAPNGGELSGRGAAPGSDAGGDGSAGQRPGSGAQRRKPDPQGAGGTGAKGPGAAAASGGVIPPASPTPAPAAPAPSAAPTSQQGGPNGLRQERQGQAAPDAVNPPAGAPGQQPGAPADEEPLLTTQTPEELRARAEREAAAAKAKREEEERQRQRAKADAQRNEFTLTGSDRPADNPGQNDMFGNSATPAGDAQADDGLDDMFNDVLNQELQGRGQAQQSAVGRPLPDWTSGQTLKGLAFRWEEVNGGPVLVATVGDKELGRVVEAQAKSSTSFGTMALKKAIVEEQLRQMGVNPDPTVRPPGGDTSAQDARARKEQRASDRSRASSALDAAIDKADRAGAVGVKSKLVDLRMAMDRRDKGPGQVMAALSRVDADIANELGQGAPRTAGQAAASAARNTAQGLTNAIDGLGALFGGKSPGRLGSGLGFDEETYAKAKPLFQAALANFQDAAADIRESMRAIVRMVLDKFGEDAARNMQPYVVRFIRDVRDGVVDAPQAGDATTTPGTRLSWANVKEWIRAYQRLRTRPPSAAKYRLIEAHIAALTDAKIGNEKDSQALRDLRDLFESDPQLKPARGQREGSEYVRILDAVDRGLKRLSGSEQPRLNMGADPVETLMGRMRRYASGLSAVGDLGAGGRAAGGSALRGVGVDVGELSQNGIETLANAVVNQRAAVFIDSGAFGAFRRGLKSGTVTPLDFDALLDKYNRILEEISVANPAEMSPGADYPVPLMVMPDIVGDQAGSIELVRQYRRWIAVEAQGNVMRPVIPIQVGDLSMAEAYAQVVDILGTDNFIVGVPSNERAVSNDEFTAFLRDAKPKAVHILGAASDRTLAPRVRSIVEAGMAETLEVTADASPIRSAIIRAVQQGAKRGQAIEDFLLEHADGAENTDVKPTFEFSEDPGTGQPWVPLAIMRVGGDEYERTGREVHFAFAQPIQTAGTIRVRGGKIDADGTRLLGASDKYATIVVDLRDNEIVLDAVQGGVYASLTKGDRTKERVVRAAIGDAAVDAFLAASSADAQAVTATAILGRDIGPNVQAVTKAFEDRYSATDDQAPAPRATRGYGDLEQIAARLGVMVNKAAGRWRATGDGGMVDIPDADADVAAQGAVSPAHVFAHELGHVVLKKRGVSFAGFPKAEILRYIPSWDEFVAASKAFRPKVHEHENERFRKHALKPDEVIADAIASVLLGDQDIALLRPLMQATGLTERDLGLVPTAIEADNAAAQAAGFVLKKGMDNEWGAIVTTRGDSGRVDHRYTLRRFGGTDATGPRRYKLTTNATFPDSGVTGAPTVELGVFDSIEQALRQFTEDSEVRQGKRVDAELVSALGLLGYSDQEIADMPNAQRIALVREAEERARAVRYFNQAPPADVESLYIGTGDEGAMFTLRQVRFQASPEGRVRSDTYVRNLSRDRDEAIRKARLYAAGLQLRFIDLNPAVYWGAPDTLNDRQNRGGTGSDGKPPVIDNTVPSTPEALLAGAGLQVNALVSSKGRPYWSVTGDTRTHEALLDALGFGKPFKMGGKWHRSVFDADPTQRLADALQNGLRPAAGGQGAGGDGTAPTDAPPADPPTDAERAAVQAAKLTVEADGAAWFVSGKGTFDLKDTLKQLGARWDGSRKAWKFTADPTAAIARAIAGRAGGGDSADDAGSGASDPEDARRSELRRREDGRADERADAGDVAQLVREDTKSLIRRGEKFGIPRPIVDEQIEDVGLILNAHAKGKPLFILANEAGTGKTYVLGGAIKELRERGESRFIYVTMNTDLIAQIQRDLADYGVSGVEFHTYAEMSNKDFDTDGAILIFDEAHNVKNVGAETARANKGQELIGRAKMTLFASATPFENPVEARYLGATGVFDGVGGFNEWAKMYGAAVKKRKFYNPRTGQEQVEEIIYWPGRGKKEDGAAARAWLFKQAVMTQRAMRIDPGMTDTVFRRAAVEPKWVALYDRVVAAYEAALGAWTDENGMPRDAKIVAEISRHRENTVKRILEASKIPFAVAEARKLLDAGRNVVIFVETKAERQLGKWKRSEHFKDDRLHTYPEMQDMMMSWQMEAAMARQQQEKPPPRPFAEFIYELARYFHDAGIDQGLPSTSDEIIAALGADNVAVYTGAVSNAVAARNKADFMAGRKRVLVATMAKGGTGLSLHDTVGNRPTSQLNINLPWKATGVDQVAARVARYGLRSRAEVTWLFASNIPWEANKLAPRVGARMREMGAIVKGVELKSAEMLDGEFDFEGDVNVKGFTAINTEATGEDGAVDIYVRAQRMERLRRKADDTSGGFFETPFPLAALMVNVAGVQAGHRMLEPSAGTGNLVRLLPEGVQVTAVERRTDNAEKLRRNAPQAEVVEGDFLALAAIGGKLEQDLAGSGQRGFTFGDVFRHPDGRLGIMRGGNGERVKFIPLGQDERVFEYVNRDDLIGVEYRGANQGGFNTILMNPPFERQLPYGAQDIEHVRRAHSLLAPGGRLVAIMGEGAFFRSYRQDEQFREWLEQQGATVIELPESAFKQSGTGVRTRMVVIDRDAKPGRTDLKLADMELESLRDVERLIPARASASREPSGAQLLMGEELTVYKVNEPGSDYDLSYDLFPETQGDLQPPPGRTLPRSGGAGRDSRPDQAGVSGVVLPTPTVSVRASPTLPGVYHVNDQLVQVNTRDLPVASVKTWQDAVDAMQAIGQFAVEHMDVLVTDKAGKPLAVVGSFKGAKAVTNAWPDTIVAEALRIKGAANAWGVHNHPSGNPDLSRADEHMGQSLRQFFNDTTVTWRGFAAIGNGGAWRAVAANGRDFYSGNVRTGAPVALRVPVVERTIRRIDSANVVITSPMAAKALVQNMSGGQAGVFFLTYSHRVTAWVPMTQDEMLSLTKDGRVAALLNSGSFSGASAAILSLPQLSSADATRAAQNVANALAKLDITVLDAVDPVTQQSATERGVEPRGSASATLFALDPNYNAAAEPATPADRGEQAATLVEQLSYVGWDPVDVPRVRAGQRLDKLLERLGKGEITESAFVDAVRLLTSEIEGAAQARREKRWGRERERGPDLVRERLLAARRRGDLDPDQVEFALWALGKNPALASGLGISVRKTPAGLDLAAADYNPATEIIRLFKGRGDETTAVHEILHHAERMMPAAMQGRIRRDWARALARAVKGATDAQRAAMLHIVPAMYGSSVSRNALMQAFRDGVLTREDHYHLVSPSEFWAVNASRLLWQRFQAGDRVYARILNWMREMLERVKSLLGARADGNVLRALDELLHPERNDGSFQSRQMLYEGAGPVDQLVSTRVPTAKKATENPLEEMLIIGLQAAKMDREAFETNMAVVRGYPNMRPLGRASADTIAERFIQHAVDNLLWLHDKVAADIRARSSLWYDGARAIVDRWTAKYKLTDAQVSAVLAVLSPQKDWFMNVSLAERVLDTMINRRGVRWNQDMTSKVNEVLIKAQEEQQALASEGEEYEPVDPSRYYAAVKRIQGKTLAEVLDSSDERDAAIWIRIYDQAFNTNNYRIVSPEGDFLDWRRNNPTKAQARRGEPGDKGRVAWGSFGEIAKAVSVIRDGSIANISTRLGGQHKVRNFYNNIFDPQSAHGDVTIDTHAVAAALLRPLAGGSDEVKHNFGSGGVANTSVFGAKGTYGLLAEAYRRAAAARNILPRQMQSITWEAVRGLFPAERKKALQQTVNAVWRRYRKGEVTLDEAREQTLQLAGGSITPPDWSGRPRGTGPAWASSYSEELAGAQLPVRGGADGGSAGRDAQGAVGDAAVGSTRGRGDQPGLTARQRRVGTLFSGARTLEGALDRAVGALAVEIDERVNEFANTAFGTAFVTRGVGDIDVQELRDADLTLLHASPVCKNFSIAKTLRGADPTDRQSALAVARAIREVRPPAVTVENVPAYADTALFQEITRALDDAGYSWDLVIHDAADYGAAQSRKRMLLRAVRDGALPPLPDKTGPTDWYSVVSDLLPDAPASTIPAVELERLQDMMVSGKLDPSKPIITMGGSGFAGYWAAANAGGPAPTLKAANEKPRIMLPDGTVKAVTPRMMARLMGLPDSFRVPDSTRFAKAVLGNGIDGNVTRKLIEPLLGAVQPDDEGPALLANPDIRYSRTTSVAQPGSKGAIVETAVADEVDKRIGQFAHQPAVRIRQTAVGILPGATEADKISGAVHDNAIYLFLDNLGSRLDVQRTLFHELLHYGLRRFLTRDQYIAEMQRLYDRDAFIKARADEWVLTDDGRRAEVFGGPQYALARGVDEALAILAEPNAGAYTRTDLFSRSMVAVTRWLADLAQRYGFDRYAATLRGYKNEEARAVIQDVFGRLMDGAAPATDPWSAGADAAFSRNSVGQGTQPDVRRMSAAQIEAEIRRLIPQVEKAYEAGPRSARMAERLDARLETLMDALEANFSELEEDQLTTADLLNPMLRSKMRDGEAGDSEADLVRDLANAWREMTDERSAYAGMTDPERAEHIRGMVDDYAWRHGGMKAGLSDRVMLDAARDAFEAVYGLRDQQLQRIQRGRAEGRADVRRASDGSPVLLYSLAPLPPSQRNSAGPTPPPQPGPVQRNRWHALKQRVMNLTSMENWETLRYKIQDRFIDLKRVQERIQALGGTISDLNDAYLGEELFHKRLATRTEDFLANEFRPLLQDMKTRGVDLETLERFLHARHAPEANAAMAQRNPSRAELDALEQTAEAELKAARLQLQRAVAQGAATQALEQAVAQHQERLAEVRRMQPFPGTEEERLSLSGMSDDEAADVMAKLTPQQRADLDALAAQVDSINAKTLESLERYGLVNRQTADAWRAKYQHYIPLHRDEAHPDSKSHPIGQGYNVRGAGVRERVGSNQRVTNILAHIAMQREAALTRGEKNLVLQRLYLLVGQNPQRDFWRLDDPPMRKTLDPVTGTVRREMDGTYRNDPNVVTLRIGGKDVSILFDQRNQQAVRLATAIKSADIGDLGAVSSFVSKGTRWFASINTQYNPIFGVINFMRDVGAAALNLSTTPLRGQELQVLAGVHHAIRAVYRQERGKGAANPENQQWIGLWRDLELVGGTTGFRDLFSDIEDRAKGLTKEIEALERGRASRYAHAVVDWLSDYNEVMENAVRVAAYKVALDGGMTKERAASLAKNLTVNFNRKGQKTRDINAWYAFFNAAVQGTARMVETLRGPAGRKIMAGGVALGAINTLVGMAVMGGFGDDDDDNWSKIPDYIRERSLIIPVSSKDYIALPMPLGFNFLPNIGRLSVEFALGGEQYTAGRQVGNLMGVLLDAFNPLGGAQPLAQLGAPTVFDPVVALLQNKDWTGRPIYREDRSPLDPQPGTALVKDTASPVSKALAAAINAGTGGTRYQPGAWSPTPDQLDYVFGQLTGGVGRELTKLSTTIAAPITGDELPLYKVPLIGRLVGSVRGSAGQSDQFYENIKAVNQIENELRGRARNNQDVQSVMREEPLAQLAGSADAYARRVSALRQMRRDLADRQPPSYRQDMERINLEIEATMRDLNARVRAVRKGVMPEAVTQ
jgi:site-specific DNA-cytosine methylase